MAEPPDSLAPGALLIASFADEEERGRDLLVGGATPEPRGPRSVLIWRDPDGYAVVTTDLHGHQIETAVVATLAEAKALGERIAEGEGREAIWKRTELTTFGDASPAGMVVNEVTWTPEG